MASICYFEPAFEGKMERRADIKTAYLRTEKRGNHEIIQRNGNKYAASIGRVKRG